MEAWSEDQVQCFLTGICATQNASYRSPKTLTPANGKHIVEWIDAVDDGNKKSGDTRLKKYLLEIGFERDSVKNAILAVASVRKSVSADGAVASVGSSSSGGSARKKSGEAKLAQEFMTEYIDKSEVVEGFTNYAIACHTEFCKSSQTFLSPYVTLVQSSGYGKTRLLREVATNFVMLYVCFRDKKSTGYPPRTNTAINALFGGLDVNDRTAYVMELKRRLFTFVVNALTMKSQLVTGDDMAKCKDPEVKALFPTSK